MVLVTVIVSYSVMVDLLRVTVTLTVLVGVIVVFAVTTINGGLEG